MPRHARRAARTVIVELGSLNLTLDLAGTFVFALSGAMAANRHRLDIFGVLALAIAAATAGGIGRDLVIGAVPPAAFADWRYLAVAVVAGLITFQWDPAINRLHGHFLVLDAAGLGFFAVSGALKALAFDLNPGTAILLGVVTAIGGGMARDILVMQIPTVLRAHLYAVAALAGATVVVIGTLLHLPSAVTIVAGGGLTFGLRVLAIRRNWQLPSAVRRE